MVNLRIEIVCQLFYAGMFTYNTLATGSGHTVFIMWNSFLNCIVVRLILAVVLEHFLGIYGVYIACGVAVASLGAGGLVVLPLKAMDDHEEHPLEIKGPGAPARPAGPLFPKAAQRNQCFYSSPVESAGLVRYT